MNGFYWSSIINKTFIIGLFGVTMFVIGRYVFRRMFHRGEGGYTKKLKGETPVTLQLTEKISKTHNVKLMKFKLDHEKEILGLPIGNHVRFKAQINGKEVTRSYTPISIDYLDDSVDFIIKIYKKGVNEKFPEGGLMTQYLDSLNPGDCINVTGPHGRIHYLGKFQTAITKNGKTQFVTVESSQVCMIAGGTGITPMLQIIRSIVIEPTDPTQIKLIFANQEYQDIILREEFDDLAQQSDNFKVHHVLSNPPENWKMSAGFIQEDILREQLPPPSALPIILLCGPPPMVAHVKKLLTQLSYEPNRTLIF